MTNINLEPVNEGFKSAAERIDAAVYMASTKFWEVIADLFPECKTGDLEPLYVFKMEEVMKETVTHWVESNRQVPRGVGIDGINLYYLDTWHQINSDIGCTVFITDDVTISGKHYYLAVDTESVTFHEDDFKTALLFNERAQWSFGDNPAVLMNYIDEFMGGINHWDTGKLFDDIMTLAKSGRY